MNMLEGLLPKRLVAFLVDCIVFYFLVFTPMMSGLLLSIGIIEPSMNMLENSQIVSGMGSVLAIALPFFLFYKSGFEYSLSQTPGKRIMNIEVRGVSGFGKALLRNLAFVFPIASIIDLMPMVFSDQRLFEKITNTEVLNSIKQDDEP